MKIFGAVFKFLPPWVPLAAVGVLLTILMGGLLALRASWEAEGAAKFVAANRQAIIDQQQRDARLSAELIQSQSIELGALRMRSATVITRIDNAPRTNGCGPVMRDASRGLHDLFGSAGGSQAGRQPAAGMH